MADSNLLPVRGKLREEGRERLIQGQFFAIGEDENRHRSELLRERSEPEICFGSARNFLFDVCKAVPFGQQDFAVLDHGDACPRSVGSIEVGKLADLTILSADIMTIPELEILKTRCVMTVINGEIVYESDSTD